MSGPELIITVLACTAGAAASYTDCRSCRVSNRLMAGAGIPLAAANTICSTLQGYSPADALICISISFIIAIVLYLAKVWAGGDVKLMMVLSSSLPWSVYGRMDEGAPIALYMMIFSAGFLFLIADTVMSVIKEKTPASVIIHDATISVKRYLISVIYITFILTFCSCVISKIIDIPGMAAGAAAFVFMVWASGRPLFRSRWMIAATAAADISMAFIFGGFHTGRVWYLYVLSLIFIMMRTVIRRFDHEEIPTAEVSAGMILSSASSAAMQRSRVKGLPGISDESLASRLTAEEADAVRRWRRSKTGEETVVTVRRMPFAIFITAGYILFILYRSMVL